MPEVTPLISEDDIEFIVRKVRRELMGASDAEQDRSIRFALMRVRKETTEACEKACRDVWDFGLRRDPGNTSYREGFDDGATDCEEAIRARLQGK